MLKSGSTGERPKEGAAGKSLPGRVAVAAAAGPERAGTNIQSLRKRGKENLQDAQCKGSNNSPCFLLYLYINLKQ